MGRSKGLSGAVSAPAGYGAAPRSKKDVSKMCVCVCQCFLTHDFEEGELKRVREQQPGRPLITRSTKHKQLQTQYNNEDVGPTLLFLSSHRSKPTIERGVHLCGLTTPLSSIV